MKSVLMLAVAAATLVTHPSHAQRTETVQCSVDDAPARPCRLALATRNGVRTLRFQLGNRPIVFVGRSQGGWWSGRLDGKPAMGFERNRGHVVFSTSDLSHTLTWYYPTNEHGTY